MLNSKLLEDFTEKLLKTIPPSLQAFKDELQGNFKIILQNIFEDLHLVSQDEFAAQTQVLAKMQNKLQALEKHIQLLEQALSTEKKEQNDHQ